MAADNFTQDGKTLEVTFSAGLPKDKLLLVGVVGQEAISRPYSYRIEMLCPDPHFVIDPAVMVGANAGIGMRLPGAEQMHFRDGFVRSFHVGGMRSDQFRLYRAEIGPYLSLLEFSTDFRIFQDITVVEVLQILFAEHGLNGVDFRISASDYPKMEYCVQCRETAFAFVSRLMEEHGIFYYFEHLQAFDGGKFGSMLVIGDRAMHFGKVDPFNLSVGATAKEGDIFQWEHAYDFRTGAWTQGDFSFTTPDQPLRSKREPRRSKVPRQLGDAFQRYEFPQNAMTVDELQVLTGVRMVAEDAQVHAVSGATQIVALAPGLRFNLSRHGAFPEESDKIYLLTSMQFTAVEQSYDGANLMDVLGGLLKGLWNTNNDKLVDLGKLEQMKDNIVSLFGKKAGDLLLTLGTSLLKGGPAGLLTTLLTPVMKPLIDWLEDQNKKHSQYSNNFIGMPSDFMFRPSRATPKPRLAGPHTALIVGESGITAPDGQDIYTDQFGRVKVYFPWDDDEGAHTPRTAWIRVADGWAGGRYGMQFPPRVGHEVVVHFLDGDPDRPLITGRIYNPKSPQPFDAPPGTPPPPPPPGPLQPSSVTVQHTQRRSGIKTASTPRPDGGPSRFHMLRFEDEWHKEQLLLRSQGRTDVTSFGSYHETVHGDRLTMIGGFDPDTGKGGGDIVTSAGGEYDLSIHKARYESVGDICQVSVKGDVTFDLQGNETTIVGKAAKLNAQEVVIEASQKITLKVGSSFVVVDPAGVFLKGAMVQINSGGAPGSTENADLTDPLLPGMADPGDPPNWLALHPPGHGGGRTHHTAEAHHGLNVTRNADGSLQLAPGVSVRGDPAYQDAVTQDMARVNDTPLGHAMLNSIGGSGQNVVIEPRPAGTTVLDTQTVYSNPTNAANGTGSGSTVQYNPNDFPAPGTTTNAPSDVALFHEMTHADHASQGTVDNTPRTDGYDSNEEFDTIQDENDYRDERGPWPGQPADSHRHDHSFSGV